jgi:hypothetical protein
MSSIANRYASAVHASSLKPKGTKGRSEDQPTATDTLGAYGLADRTLTEGYDRHSDRNFTPAPLAVPLARLLAGDGRAMYEIVRILSEMAFEESYRLRIKVRQSECTGMAQATIAWYRNGTCTHCGGHGWEAIPGAPMLSARECAPCRGAGKVPFLTQFEDRLVPLASWMRDRVEESVAKAGPQAMRHLAPSLDLGGKS